MFRELCVLVKLLRSAFCIPCVFFFFFVVVFFVLLFFFFGGGGGGGRGSFNYKL